MKTDVAIVGGGPAGTTCAMFLAREGIRSVIIEKETYPRYHIGESMSGECGAVLRVLGIGDEMYRRRHPVKRGLTVYGKGGENPWYVKVQGRNAEGKLFDQETWQVRRSDYDQFMLDEAVARGATLLPGQATRPLSNDDGLVRGVQVRMADGGKLDVESEVLLDCSGQATWLANLGGVTGPKYVGNYDKQIAIFSQVSGALRDEGLRHDDTLIFYREKYHWAWWIPLDEEVVSVGVVIPASYFLDKKESRKDFLIRELHAINPEIVRRIPEVKLIEEARVIPNYSYQVRRFTGQGFICVGDSHRFIDPIFSFGLFLAVKEAQYIAPVIRDYLGGAGRDDPNPFGEYQLFAEKGVDVLEDFIDCFWVHPLAWAAFMHTRYTEFMVDIFAGRIYEAHGQPSPATLSMRRALGRERERSYLSEDEYSVPIGARFHPELAELWSANSEIEITEDWMGQR